MHTTMLLLGINGSWCMYFNIPGVNDLFVLHLCLLQYNVLPICAKKFTVLVLNLNLLIYYSPVLTRSFGGASHQLLVLANLLSLTSF